jgi:PAS domain-containing protein
MIGFGMALYMSGCITFESCVGGVLSGIGVILMNFPALFIIEIIKSRLLFDIISFIINLAEIVGYTAIIYFLGGIRAAYLVPVYSAVISYVGVIAPKRYPYIIAGCSSMAFAGMVIAESLGIIPHQNLEFLGDVTLIYEAWIILMVASSLFGVAVITSYSSGIIKTTRNDLIEKNREIEDSRRELRLYSESLEKSEWKYRRVFESIQNIYLEVEKDGTIIEISPSVLSIAGVKREALIGTSIFRITAPYPVRIRQMMDDIF